MLCVDESGHPTLHSWLEFELRLRSATAQEEPHGWEILLCSAFPVIVPIATCHESSRQVSVRFICLGNTNVEEGEAHDASLQVELPRIRRAFRSLLAKLPLPK
jgi:hypothetical protein